MTNDDGWTLYDRAASSSTRAIEAFTRALAIEPTYTPALVMRGHASRNRLDTAAARADWLAAQRLGDPHAASLLAQLES